ncbi:ACP phosphodiesterase [Arenimonas composti]|uniref:Acyl carrier protein phosphodiesterase n=1 Tax=Arenimonas composti TR7-09 = DSM 18010 TaxID=1121013 RepID=A0A091BFB2_9GAMM|nr:ACP phosphodiesterase [Arenimonas composti]KFN49469.1 hypothetical protein P873_10880 [Arenimonas composti TR7-09 = DSM 18010]
MNYLAHITLARHSPAAMLGGLLGDFVFGRAALSDWAPEVRIEILVHRRIDHFTDTFPAVEALRTHFPQGLRRYAGIAIDVFFDHCLARDWPRWCDEPLATLTARFHRILLATLDDPAMPPRLRRIAPHMVEHDWLGSYARRDNVDLAVRRIATRLSRHGDRLIACLDGLRAHEGEAAAAFAALFPQLGAFAEAQRRDPALIGDVHR